MDNNYIYMFEGNLYVNLTNKCCNDCEFCVRNERNGIDENAELWLEHEPSEAEVISAFDSVPLNSYGDVVFCGFGEPTYRLKEMIALARHAKSFGKRTRLNTNGLGSLINGYNIVDSLANVIDKVSISLNESSSEKYQKICHSIYDNAFEELQNFGLLCAKAGIETRYSVVDCIGEVEVEKCKKLVDNLVGQYGGKLRVRAMIK